MPQTGIQTGTKDCMACHSFSGYVSDSMARHWSCEWTTLYRVILDQSFDIGQQAKHFYSIRVGKMAAHCARQEGTEGLVRDLSQQPRRQCLE